MRYTRTFLHSAHSENVRVVDTAHNQSARVITLSVAIDDRAPIVSFTQL